MESGLLILGWHNVEGTWAFPSRPGDGTRGLRRQLQLLRQNCNVVPLGRALADLAARRPLPPRAVALTFDDGYRDNLDLAVPMLRDLGLPATFFLVPAVLSREVVPWWETLGRAFARSRRRRLDWEDRCYELADERARGASFAAVADQLKQRDFAAREVAVAALVAELDDDGADGVGRLFLNWDDAQELAGSGFEIGSHSRRHAILAQETAEEQNRDLRTARQLLQERLGTPAELLAYPNGRRMDYDRATVAAAGAAGHSGAVTTEPGRNYDASSPLELRRHVVYPERSWRMFVELGRHRVREFRRQARV